MPNIYSSKQIIFVLELLGYKYKSQKGSHGKFENSQGEIVIVPMHKKDIPEGTFRAICKQASISIKDFKQKLMF